jgi:hypothetical protein|tara:strand:- start:371 stop:784 length:414 start_codon:yes stop_codon:yes gene_type:complete
MKTIFPKSMMMSGDGAGEMNLESVASKLTYFHEQLHLLHWQTTSYAEHQALGALYDYVHDFKDGVMEKLMGYTGKRPGVFKIPALSIVTPESCVDELMSFATQLKNYGDMNGFHDIGNLADALSGEAAKTKYLLTLS